MWARIAKDSTLGVLGARFNQFDALADYFQAQYRARLLGICILTLGFLTAFEFYAHLLKEQTWLIFGALASLVAAFLLLRVFRSKEVQTAYLCSRCVAEFLRIQFFLLGSGMEVPIVQQLPRRYSGALHMPRGILASVWAEAQASGDARLDEEVVRTQWLEAQKQYFTEAIDRNHNWAHGLELASTLLFGLGILCIAALATIAVTQRNVQIEEILLSAGPSLIVLAAIIEFFSERRGFRANAERYHNIVHIFSNLDPDETWETRLQTIAQEALSENIDWYVTSVEREIAIPKG